MNTENPDSALNDALSAAFDEIQTTSAEDTSSTPAPEPAKRESEATKVEATEVDKAATPEPEKAPIEPAKAEAPKSWRAEAKAKFNTLDPEVQAEILKRESDVEKGFSEYSGDRKYAQEIKEVIQPYMAIIQAEGGTPATAVKDLLNTAYQLRTASPQAKAQLLQSIAQQYGVDMSLASQEEEYVDPALIEARNKVNQLDGEVSRINKERALEVINVFKSKPENVHFEALKGEMGNLITLGRAKTLEEAYEQAKWLNPEVRQKLLAEQKDKDEQERIAKQKEEAKAAKRTAGTQLSSKAAVTGASKAATLDETLERAFDRINAA